MEKDNQAPSESAHICISFRISNFYLALVVLQLLLSFVLLLALTYDYIVTADIIQIWIGFFFGLDLLIRYFSQQNNFFREVSNYVDILVLLVMGLCIGASQIDFGRLVSYHQGNILSTVVILFRYSFQAYRIICLVKTSKSILQINKVNEQIDLKCASESLFENDAIQV